MSKKKKKSLKKKKVTRSQKSTPKSSSKKTSPKSKNPKLKKATKQSKDSLERSTAIVEILEPTKKNENLPQLQSEKRLERSESTNSNLRTQDSLTQYLQEIRKYPVLNKEQENELALKYYEEGDSKAAEALVRANLRFVVKVALEYSKFGSRVIDLIQEGNVGLMHAVREYNPYKGVRLISYAVWWIRGYIQDYLMKQQSLVKIGTNQKQRKLYYQLEKEKNKILQEGLESTPKLLSQRLDVKEKDVIEMQKRLKHGDLSLDQKISDENDTTWLDRQTEDESEDLDETFINLEQVELLKEKISELKKDLNEREIELLDQRILNDEPVTLKSLGDKWGVTREAARQTEARLIEKIKRAFLHTSD